MTDSAIRRMPSSEISFEEGRNEDIEEALKRPPRPLSEPTEAYMAVGPRVGRLLLASDKIAAWASRRRLVDGRFPLYHGFVESTWQVKLEEPMKPAREPLSPDIRRLAAKMVALKKKVAPWVCSPMIAHCWNAPPAG
jgi:hypothetical protein